MYDINALLDAADALTVAQHLGIEIKRKGSRNFIRCPGHESRLGKPDYKISNCVLFDKGYKCFACGESVGIIQMVQEVTGCSFAEALDIIADTCGGSSLYQTTNKKSSTPQKQALRKEDLEIIGINPDFDEFNGIIINGYNSPIYVDSSKIKTYVIKKGHEYLVCQKKEMLTLSKILTKNKKLYRQIVAQKAKEAMIKYETALRVFCSRDAEKANVVFDLLNEGGQISDDVFFKLANEFQTKYWRAKEIYEEYKE